MLTVDTRILAEWYYWKMHAVGWHTSKWMNTTLNSSYGKPNLHLSLFSWFKCNVLFVTLSQSPLEREIVSIDQRTIVESLTQNYGGLHRWERWNRIENSTPLPRNCSFKGWKLTGRLLYLTLPRACISNHEDRVPHGQEFLELDNLQTKQPVTGFPERVCA